MPLRFPKIRPHYMLLPLCLTRQYFSANQNHYPYLSVTNKLICSYKAINTIQFKSDKLAESDSSPVTAFAGSYCEGAAVCGVRTEPNLGQRRQDIAG
jgi:hypothetical protein